LIFSDDNLGVCGGRMVLFKEAIGDIIISIDSDAFLLNNDFFDRVIKLLYDESNGIIGISGAYLRSWIFGTQEDISEYDPNEYYVDHIAGCCQCFRREIFLYGFGLDPYYGKFWVEDTDLSMQSLELNKNNIKINQHNYLDHHWGGSGRDFKDLFEKNWNYFPMQKRLKITPNTSSESIFPAISPSASMALRKSRLTISNSVDCASCANADSSDSSARLRQF
jgi:GT2 family glycosyltransferase